MHSSAGVFMTSLSGLTASGHAHASPATARPRWVFEFRDIDGQQCWPPTRFGRAPKLVWSGSSFRRKWGRLGIHAIAQRDKRSGLECKTSHKLPFASSPGFERKQITTEWNHLARFAAVFHTNPPALALSGALSLSYSLSFSCSNLLFAIYSDLIDATNRGRPHLQKWTAPLRSGMAVHGVLRGRKFLGTLHCLLGPRMGVSTAERAASAR